MLFAPAYWLPYQDLLSSFESAVELVKSIKVLFEYLLHLLIVYRTFTVHGHWAMLETNQITDFVAVI